ncbi:DEAD/DEAH box helicase [Nocardiopsis sp. LDBS1602]|uniref:DEAD/DEAH box helicase n=1 Tax=Nocardiopsis sp. LDBS1602 TaxID=3109597 RepID=UPI002DBD7652|nr:type ISP restriction/modification enzyme [Nocardiopsis sp. LDBS1602]MEC3894395.1 type ISP restriction/modification enzyme [Nocardiopsis sp. LDBS1602]
MHDIIDSIRQHSSSNHERGSRFEKLMVAYLTHDPLYAQRFTQVWSWTEWPGAAGNKKDIGIDLVAETIDGGYCAIQCKFYEPQHTVQKPDIDSFFSASGKAPFTERLIISTTDKWGPNAKEVASQQQIPVSVIGLSEIDASPIGWSWIFPQFATELEGSWDLHRIPPKEPRPHQVEAIEAVFDGFTAHSRGKLIMACGTGKTFTSLKVAERLAREQAAEKDGEPTRVLFLVPSISLLSQTLREWSAQCQVLLRSFAVCSDTKVSKKNQADDFQDLSSQDLALPATTNATKLVEQVEAVSAVTTRVPADGALQVVFSTYQSIQTIHEAQKAGLADFDLVVCDEAHRTTGVTLAGTSESHFVKVHDNNYLRADLRLYMTATPRLFNEDTQSAAKAKDAVLCSMDDENLYGPEFHRLGFGEAVEKGLLTDYKVLILNIDQEFLSASLQEQMSQDGELNIDDAARIIGCWNGLAKRAGKTPEGQGFRSGEAPMQRAVAFARNIADSKSIQSRFSTVVDAVNKERDDRGEPRLRCEVEHVDGGFNAMERNRLLDWLKADPGEGNCRILSNARCLSEGVDVPDLDAVLFLNPRNSVVDVVQSVGRVMRKADGKDFGYIILPVGIPSNQKPEEALRDNQRYKVVWQVLQALRAHDDRFNATVNQIDFNKKKPDNIMVGVVGAEDFDGTREGVEGQAESDTAGQFQQTMLSWDVEELQEAVYTRIVEKVGERHYWEDWAKDIAQIAERHVSRIKVAIADPASDKGKAFARFVVELRANLNPGVTHESAIDMLAQHMITKPVFDALFGDYAFSKQNPVSVAMDEILQILEDESIGSEAKALEGFYASVRKRAEGIDNHEGRQRVITELYEKFFKTALPKTAEAFGIVYTPVEVVDFILRATNQALYKHFNQTLSGEGVHIIDPFTGTGTFVVRLLQSGLIKSEDLLRKYTQELHANEIVLLAYYIAAVNIEAAFHERHEGDYTPFEGIVLTDTFQLSEDLGAAIKSSMLGENSERATRQQGQELRVVIGNPPYSSGQTSQNDNNQNQKYPVLDGRITDTYAALSSAQNKNSLYDSYIRAIRWASDRINDTGVIAYVSNGGYIDGNTADGLRKSLAEEFDTIYCFNLRGNQRTAGEQSRMEGGKVFGSGSRSTVAILILVKDGSKSDGCELLYRDIGDYLTREQKLKIVDESDLDTITWQKITPSAEGDWVNQRDPRFPTFRAIGDRDSDRGVFASYSSGLKTGRDAWVYSYDDANLRQNVGRMVDFYNLQVETFKKHSQAAGIVNPTSSDVESFISYNSEKISWNRADKTGVKNGKKYSFNEENLFTGTYRPFNKQRVCFDRRLNDMVYLLPSMFPAPELENFGFYVTGTGNNEPFSVLMMDTLPDLHAVGTMSVGPLFPRYTYRETGNGDDLFSGGEEPGWERVDNITNKALADYRQTYGSEVTEDDIFFYVYGLLHSPDYRSQFAADLKKSLPRIPKVAGFHDFAEAGRKLSKLHIGYENVQPYALEEKVTGPTLTPLVELYRVQKMKFQSKDDRSSIIYNSRVTVSGIPERAYQYQLGARSAIEWIIDRYQVKTHKDSGIVNDPNDWSDDPRYIIDLLGRIVTVSLETVDIVEGLPELEILKN